MTSLQAVDKYVNNMWKFPNEFVRIRCMREFMNIVYVYL